MAQLIEETFLAEVAKLESQKLFHPEVLASEAIFGSFSAPPGPKTSGNQIKSTNINRDKEKLETNKEKPEKNKEKLEENKRKSEETKRNPEINKEAPEINKENRETIKEKQQTKQKQKMTRDRAKTQVRVLTLNDKEHQDSTLYRLEKSWVLQFRLGPSLLGRKVQLHCNYPEKPKAEFNRNCYRPVPWCLDEGCNNTDDTSAFCEINIHTAGSFHYYFTHDADGHLSPQGSGFFIVDPEIQYGNNEVLPLDCIQCQTVLAKGLGKFSTWEDKLRVAKESGYNMIHFTPIQELGGSNSSYR